jgi:hypothetical protein
MTTYNNTTNPLPDKLAGLSPFMVNTLLEIGYSENSVNWLLRFADANDDHPDWSESSTDEIDRHFRALSIKILLAEITEQISKNG